MTVQSTHWLVRLFHVMFENPYFLSIHILAIKYAHIQSDYIHCCIFYGSKPCHTVLILGRHHTNLAYQRISFLSFYFHIINFSTVFIIRHKRHWLIYIFTALPIYQFQVYPMYRESKHITLPWLFINIRSIQCIKCT